MFANGLPDITQRGERTTVGHVPPLVAQQGRAAGGLLYNNAEHQRIVARAAEGKR
jgi:hypothetical protein